VRGPEPIRTGHRHPSRLRIQRLRELEERTELLPGFGSGLDVAHAIEHGEGGARVVDDLLGEEAGEMWGVAAAVRRP
jgi:hypothetical protein